MARTTRGRVLLLSSTGKVALIRRRRGGQVYWSLPGGRRNRNEGSRAAARREVAEELELDVRPRRLITVAAGHAIYLARLRGEPQLQMHGHEVRDRGSSKAYRPTWVPAEQLAGLDLRPRSGKQALVRLPELRDR